MPTLINNRTLLMIGQRGLFPLELIDDHVNPPRKLYISTENGEPAKAFFHKCSNARVFTRTTPANSQPIIYEERG